MKLLRRSVTFAYAAPWHSQRPGPFSRRDRPFDRPVPIPRSALAPFVPRRPKRFGELHLEHRFYSVPHLLSKLGFEIVPELQN
jgi:hypothetical protein